jgi:hypothetical protein
MVGVGVTLGVTVMVAVDVAVSVGVAVQMAVAVALGAGVGLGVAGSIASMESAPLQPLNARASIRLIQISAVWTLPGLPGLREFPILGTEKRICLILL